MNGCREKPVKNRESVPVANLRTGTSLGEILGHQVSDTAWDEMRSMCSIHARLNFTVATVRQIEANIWEVRRE